MFCGGLVGALGRGERGPLPLSYLRRRKGAGVQGSLESGVGLVTLSNRLPSVPATPRRRVAARRAGLKPLPSLQLGLLPRPLPSPRVSVGFLTC